MGARCSLSSLEESNQGHPIFGLQPIHRSSVGPSVGERARAGCSNFLVWIPTSTTTVGHAVVPKDVGGAIGHLLEDRLGLGKQSTQSIPEIEGSLGATLEHWPSQRSIIRLMTRHRDQFKPLPANHPKAPSFQINQHSKIRSASTRVGFATRFVPASLDEILTLQQCGSWLQQPEPLLREMTSSR
jgi:hypothetical protein